MKLKLYWIRTHDGSYEYFGILGGRSGWRAATPSLVEEQAITLLDAAADGNGKFSTTMGWRFPVEEGIQYTLSLLTLNHLTQLQNETNETNDPLQS